MIIPLMAITKAIMDIISTLMSNCDRMDKVFDSHVIGPRFAIQNGQPFTGLYTECYTDVIIEERFLRMWRV